MLRATNTHLYPGARLRGPLALRVGQRLTIEFSDLGSAAARVDAAADGEATLAVSAHATARGTAIAAKRWLIELSEPAEQEGEWRVRRRVSA
ncbi:MAG: hypothetical protein LCI02_00985 [Proteobacteria bacterium]|nr:hypothetical protein [Pseudomonadota bacterium]